MYEEITNTAKTLADRDAGWVDRRDSAQKLGDIAAKALEALREFDDELDVDVRRAVDEALENASGALAGVEPVRRAQQAYSLEDLARSCEREDKRVVAPHEDGYVVEVDLKGDRRQNVFIMPHTLRDGAKIIRVYTRCGVPNDQSLEWALRANMKLSQGAVAIDKKGDEKEFVLINCFLATETTPAEIKDAVKRIAFYGDWVESKLSDLDEF